MKIPLPNRPNWLKNRGYLHITPKIDVSRLQQEIISKVQSKGFVARHGFFPLIHSVIKERRFKKHPKKGPEKKHSHKLKGERIEKTAKLRPLHYSTHIDSLIFGYYAHELLTEYKAELDKVPGLAECITAYRKIPISASKGSNGRGKGTIDFANDAFQEIRKRAQVEDCIVLLFDIKSFFNELNHEKLKLAWAGLYGKTELDEDQYNVFKATTNFRYILLDDLRISKRKYSRRSGFNERKLFDIRKNGIESYFGSINEFKDAIESRQLTVYRHPFVKNKRPVGIPQGLPISTVLANLYLLKFDKDVLEEVVKNRGAYYRRYSDDILVVCKVSDAECIEKFMKECITRSDLEISDAKTEKFLFQDLEYSQGKKRLTSILLAKDQRKVIGRPLTYLGFEFYGYKTLIKSTNLAKFYRRLIYSVKRQADRARKVAERDGLNSAFIYKGRLKRKFAFIDLDRHEDEVKEYKRKKLVRDENGDFRFKFQKKKRKRQANYFSYVYRASRLMKEPAIVKQLRKHKQILSEAINRHLRSNR